MDLIRSVVLLLGFILMLAGLPAIAVEPAVLDSSRESLSLNSHVTYAADSKGQADANLMFGMAARDRFKPLPDESAAFGFTEGAHWFHARLFNQDNSEQRWLLVLHYPLLDNVDVFVRYPDGRVEHSASGDNLPFSARSIRYRHPNFWVDLPQRTEVELLVRVATRSSLQAPLALYTPTAFAELERDSQFSIGLFYGILFALLSYNLVLWLAVKEAGHFWYSFHVAGIGLVMFCLNGLAFEYLWPNLPWWANQAIPVSMALSQIGMHQFCRVFLELKQRHPAADKVSLGLIGFFVLMGAASFALEYRTVVRPMTLAVFPGALFIMYATVLSIRSGYTPARVFLLAWAVLLLGMGLYAAVSFGLVEKNFLTEYGIQIGSALEMILLSFALAYRYARLRGENERLVRGHNEELERAVANRTSELRTALEQLADANQRLRESNRVDSLTGLFNRRHFRDMFEKLVHRASEHRQSLGVLLIDLDHFKRVNDTHGHLAGDECLRRLSRVLQDTLAEHGALLARFGGEEFVVAVPDVQPDQLLQIAEKLRLGICAEPVRYAGNNIPISASIGAYLLRPGTDISIDQALHLADDAMYAAKNRGRNCVHVAALSPA